MIALALTAALISTVSAPPEIHARMQMSADGSITGIVENLSGVRLPYVEVRCKIFDATGLIIDALDGFVGGHDLGPHEAGRFEGSGSPLGKPERFSCTVSYSPELR